jgi:hypothetical protein
MARRLEARKFHGLIFVVPVEAELAFQIGPPV